MSFTGAIGAASMFPLNAIIRLCVRLRIKPNFLTLFGVLVNIAAAYTLAIGHFVTAGFIMIIANIFDFIDGKVAERTNLASDFGGFDDLGDSDEYEVEIYEDEDGSFYYIDPDTGEEVPCDEDGNAL